MSRGVSQSQTVSSGVSGRVEETGGGDEAHNRRVVCTLLRILSLDRRRAEHRRPIA